jgi:hypothetical protein
MRLLNAQIAVVSERKILDYLLNFEHPDGASKAKFFNSIGFRQELWQELAIAFRQIAMTNPITGSVESEHGRKYIIDGEIVSPEGVVARVRTVWIIDEGYETPRLVTAYPC